MSSGGFINVGIVDEIPVAGVSMILGNKTVESMVTPPSPLFNVWASRPAEVYKFVLIVL